MEQQDIFSNSETLRPSVKEYVLKYLSYWPLFIVSILLCIGAGILYSKYTVPKYVASTLIYVKGIENSGSQSGDLIESALSGKPDKPSGLEDQIQLLKSSSLMERVIEKNKSKFNISYYVMGRLRNSDIYDVAPFQLVPEFIGRNKEQVTFLITNLSPTGGTFYVGGTKKGAAARFFWNQPIWQNNKRFTFIPNPNTSAYGGEFLVTWKSAKDAAAELSDKLTLKSFNSKTSIIELDILIENLKRGKDVLDAVAREFNLSDVQDNITITENTVNFINERLNIISKELSDVEGNLESYQGGNTIINLPTQTSQFLTNTNDLTKSISQVSIQRNVVQMIQEYINNEGNQDKLVPSSLGINDGTLAELITRYNELQLRRERERPLVTAGSLLFTDLNNQIRDIKSSIQESLQNISKNLILQETSFEQRNLEYRQYLSSLPGKERRMQEIKRKQTITESLYLYLLQKREEASIKANYSNISRFHQIDPAKGYGPVQPNNTNILLYSSLLGLILPIGLVSLKDLLNDSVMSKNDFQQQKVTIPVIGELEHLVRDDVNGIAVLGKPALSEQFRMLRSSLISSHALKDNKVYLITSSKSGEGKSFVSINLATILAIPGKKVALLEFDFRNPTLNSVREINLKMGLTHFLKGITSNLQDIHSPVDEIPSLHIYSCGETSNIPADILVNDRMDLLFNKLRMEYDFIIVDSAPSGLVSDAFVLNEYCDAVLYIVRQRYSLKRELAFVNELVSHQKFKNLSLIFNDVKSGDRYGTGYRFKTKNSYLGVSSSQLTKNPRLYTKA